MTPRAWAAWSAAALIVVLTSTNPVYRALVLLVALNVLLASRRPDAPLRGLFLAVGVTAVIATLFNALLSHTGTHVLVSLPSALPGVGGPITVEAVLYGLDIALGIAAAVLATAPLSRVLHAHDVVDAMPRTLQRTATLVGSAVNLVPAVARNAVQISEAQRMRGTHGTRLRDWHAVAAPVVLSALDDSVQLAEAMEARGFGARTRTRYTSPSLQWRGAAVIAAAAAAVVVTIVARMTGALPDWYAYPTVTAPAIDALPLLACLLIATPLVPWRHS